MRIMRSKMCPALFACKNEADQVIGARADDDVQAEEAGDLPSGGLPWNCLRGRGPAQGQAPARRRALGRALFASIYNCSCTAQAPSGVALARVCPSLCDPFGLRSANKSTRLVVLENLDALAAPLQIVASDTVQGQTPALAAIPGHAGRCGSARFDN